MVRKINRITQSDLISNELIFMCCVLMLVKKRSSPMPPQDTRSLTQSNPCQTPHSNAGHVEPEIYQKLGSLRDRTT